MSEESLGVRLHQFKSLAGFNAEGAQEYLKRHFITPGVSYERMQSDFMTAVGRIAQSYGGASFQTTQPYERLLGQIEDAKVRAVIENTWAEIGLGAAPEPVAP